VTTPQPTRLRKQSPALRALALGLAVLGLCVFAWGLRYKLSLYDPPHPGSHPMAAAKLLTGNERRALPAVEPRLVADSASLAFLTVFVFAAVVFKQTRVAPALAHFLLSPAGRRIVPVRVPCSTFFTRPPPRSR